MPHQPRSIGKMLRCLLLSSAVLMASAFSPAMPQGIRCREGRASRAMGICMKGIRVEKDVEAVGKALCDILAVEAEKAIKDHGHFTFSIPGGSVLKMLSGMDASRVDWRWE